MTLPTKSAESFIPQASHEQGVLMMTMSGNPSRTHACSHSITSLPLPNPHLFAAGKASSNIITFWMYDFL